jgi:hypothetical protein
MITTTVETITPEIAKKMLEVNRHNRGISWEKVHQYARDMKAGKWYLSHQGIGFGKDENLIDGQHRLFAVIEAGVAIETQVTHGLDRETQEVIDGNLPRRDHDKITFGGNIGKVSPDDVSLAKAMVAGASSKKKTMTILELELFIGRHRDAIQFAVESLPKTKCKGVSAARLRAVVARAWYTEDRAELAHFCDVMTTSRARSDRDDAIIMLRNWLTSSTTTSGGGKMQAMIYGKSARALLAYLRDERIKNLIAATTNVFPLPEEMDKPI